VSQHFDWPTRDTRRRVRKGTRCHSLDCVSAQVRTLIGSAGHPIDRYRVTSRRKFSGIQFTLRRRYWSKQIRLMSANTPSVRVRRARSVTMARTINQPT